MQLVVQIAHRGAAEFEHIHDLVTWPEAMFPGIVDLDDPQPAAGAPTGLRAIKSAAPAQYVPYEPAAKYVSVIRDPKDICVSAYYFLTGIFGMREAIDLRRWVDMALAPGGFLTVWPGHLASYWAMRERPNVRLLEFAEMKRDLGSAVDTVAALMDVKLEPDERAEVIRRSSFDYMKAHEDQFAPPRLPILTGRERGQMMRTGKVGSGKQSLSAAEAQRIDEMILAALDKLGCDFPYAERFGS